MNSRPVSAMLILVVSMAAGCAGRVHTDDTMDAVVGELPLIDNVGEPGLPDLAHRDAGADSPDTPDVDTPDGSHCAEEAGQCGRNETCRVGAEGVIQCECLAPLVWWDDFNVPDNVRQGIEPGPPVIRSCDAPMAPEVFEGIPCPYWRGEYDTTPGVPEDTVHVWYDATSGRLRFDYIVPNGVQIRSDGIGVLWSGDSSRGHVSRVEFSTQRVRFVTFERSTGAFYAEAAWVPLASEFCPKF